MFLIIVIVVTIVVLILRSKLKSKLKRRFAENELVRDYINFQCDFFIKEIQEATPKDYEKNIEVEKYGEVHSYGFGLRSFNFKEHHMKELNDYECQCMFEVVTEGIIEAVKSKLPIHLSHDFPTFRVKKDGSTFYIIYTASNKNYITPKSW